MTGVCIEKALLHYSLHTCTGSVLAGKREAVAEVPVIREVHSSVRSSARPQSFDLTSTQLSTIVRCPDANKHGCTSLVYDSDLLGGKRLAAAAESEWHQSTEI